jgi:hypothetical protein
MLDISPNDPIVKVYLRDIERLEQQQVSHELGLKGPFHNLLDRAARKRGWTLVPELATYSGGKRIVPDGTVRDEFRLARGWWEAKDTSDRLAAEIGKKLKAGYPTRNTIFEDTRTAVLYQDRAEAGEYVLREPVKIADLLNRFFSHDESDEREFQRAMDEFKSRIPDLAQSLHEHIAEAHKRNPRFQAAFGLFVTRCRQSLNPELSDHNRIKEVLLLGEVGEIRAFALDPCTGTGNVIVNLIEDFQAFADAGRPEAFEYRLGSKSAIEWVIDQYQVKGDSDPNRDDDSGYIVRLLGQVVRVSVETARIVKNLPAFR